MTEHDQQIALCEWMGWKPSPVGWRHQHNGQWFPVLNSDTNDLNVLHEMEKKLTDGEAMEYERALRRAYHGKAYRLVVSATAPQRRESLLRTLGLWK